jgi:hypothetical protein
MLKKEAERPLVKRKCVIIREVRSFLTECVYTWWFSSLCFISGNIFRLERLLARRSAEIIHGARTPDPDERTISRRVQKVGFISQIFLIRIRRLGLHNMNAGWLAPFGAVLGAH